MTKALRSETKATIREDHLSTRTTFC